MSASPSRPPRSSNIPSSNSSKTSKAAGAPEKKEGKSDYYTLLGLRPGASVQDIRRAYRDLSKLYHPDTTALESAIATVKFQALNEAYATLSSPEKRLAYDYKIGYSRLSVMQHLSQNAPKGKAYNPTDSAYLDPTDRPLSAGELFALFILGVTFIGCLVLVFTMGLTKSELPIVQGATVPEVTSPEALSPQVIPFEPAPPDLNPLDDSLNDTDPAQSPLTSPNIPTTSPKIPAPKRSPLETFTL